MKLKRYFAAVLAIGMISLVSGCKTAEDVKDDVKEGVDKVEDKVEQGVNDVTGKNDNVKIDVTLTVEAKDIIGSEYEKSFNEEMLVDKGVVLSQTKYTVNEGTTVDELIRKAMDESKIEYNITGTGPDTLLETIRGIKNGMAGETSGWVYEINGKSMTDTMSNYRLKNGDDVKVYYKLNTSTNMNPTEGNSSTTGQTENNNTTKK